jgi:hypothetical protein
MKNNNSNMLQNRTSLLEFIIATVVMSIVLLIMMKINYSNVSRNLSNVDVSVNNLSQNVKEANSTLNSMTLNMDTLSVRQAYTMEKQFELIDSIAMNNELLRRNNYMLQQHSDYLKVINRKQSIIYDSIRNKTIYY